MKIHEYQASTLFKEAGIPALDGDVATEISEAQDIASRIGFPVVLKSQVLVGGRGKAGGIKVVKNKEELEKQFKAIKGLTIKGYSVDRIFVVRAIDIKKEFYAAVTIDHVKNDIVIIASDQGGVDIEETARRNPDAIQKYYLNGTENIDQERWGGFIKAVFSDEESQRAGTEIFQKLLKFFIQYDCSLAEINPLVIDAQGQWFAADAKVNFDENALFRHQDIQDMKDLKYEDPDELEAKQHDLSFVKLDGNVGCVVNGAGLAMATMDIVKLLGGQPANFLDVGGSSSPQKVIDALKIIMRNKNVKTILINIFGGITRCDDIAQGILEAKKQMNITVPLVVRLTGTNEQEAKELLAKNKINTYPTMREAVLEVVKIANG